MKTLLAIGLMAALSACTDAEFAKFAALGDSAHVKCWSADNVIFDGRSTGKVTRADTGADGYYFVDQADGALKEVSGNCVVTYGAGR